jgi:hypothetical protein
MTIPHFSQSNPAREVVRLTVANQSAQASFLALAAPWITIPTSICTKLNIAYDQTISILDVKPIQPHTRPPFRTEGEKVDMLSLIPLTSSNGYQLHVDEYENNGEQWLRIWYHHPRGAARQIELRRYVDLSKLGQVLGLLQAEGDKNSDLVAFKNSSLSEHSDFVSSLRELGISTSISARCTFNPNKSSDQKAGEYSEAYAKATGVTISTIDRMDGMKGTIAAYTYVRSTILAQILMFAMDEVRTGHIQNASIRRNFLAKLLSGDGSLGARRTSKRLDVRLTIVDQNIEALDDYAKILSEEGFKARVIAHRITVRAYCTWLNLLRLYEIGAFRNGKNWIKLLCAIMITMQGRENRGYKRIQELSGRDVITSDDISATYGIGRRASNLWIHTMFRKGLMEILRSTQGYGRKNYVVSANGKRIARLIEAIERDYNEMAAQRGIDDAETILRQTKTRTGPSRTQESGAKAVIHEYSALIALN